MALQQVGVYGDHLGSTSLTTSATGATIADQRYFPYGGVRWSSGETKSEFGFTSQRQEKGLGLYDYNARYFSPKLGKFIPPVNFQVRHYFKRGV